MSLPEALQAMLEVARVFEDLDVTYLVGGSLASSLYGIPRSTQDADLVADLRQLKVRRGRIDLSYLRLWASRLGLDELLERALEDAGTDT
jgi:hypothetical protein